MRPRIALTGAVLVVLAALAGCNKPASPPGDVAVADVVLGRALAPDGTIAEDARTNHFWTTDTFYASVTLEGTAADVTLAARWTGPDGAAAESSKSVSPRGTTQVAFEAPPPQDGRWPEGDYRVEILINGASQATRDLNAR